MHSLACGMNSQAHIVLSVMLLFFWVELRSKPVIVGSGGPKT
jgi:hypothetical protein